VIEGLSGALTATQTRLATGLVEAEAELARARKRCRELRQKLALARARESAVARTPARQPQREMVRPERIAALTRNYLGGAATPAVPIPRRWRRALETIRRLEVGRFPQIFAPNIVMSWSGNSSLSGTHLGSVRAAEVAAEIAGRIRPGSVVVEELTGAAENLEVLARVTFENPELRRLPLETTIHAVFRFDDVGRITLLFASPYDPQAVDRYLG